MLAIKFHDTTMLVALMLFCGTLTVGCAEKDKATVDVAAVSIPTVSFEIPDPAGAALTTAEPGNDILTNWQQRVNDIVERLNVEIGIMNKALEMMEGAGSFTGKGPAGNISGTVTETTDGYSGTICVNDEVFNVLTWATDGSSVTSTRDANNTPVTANQKDFKVRVVYTASENTSLELNVHGDLPATAPAGTEGEYLTEYVKAIDVDGEFTIKGVNDWAAEAGTSFAADGYLTGKIGADGSGEYLAYSTRFPTVCTEVFSEASANFCLGRAIGNSARFTAEERTEAWERLQTIGVAPAAELEAVSVTGSCP